MGEADNLTVESSSEITPALMLESLMLYPSPGIKAKATVLFGSIIVSAIVSIVTVAVLESGAKVTVPAVAV